MDGVFFSEHTAFGLIVCEADELTSFLEVAFGFSTSMQLSTQPMFVKTLLYNVLLNDGRAEIMESDV